MSLTPNQAEAVERRGCNLLVSASAGSGKTEVLARRCVALITDADSPCDVDRLLVVTFTRAAAAELRSRIGRALQQRLLEINGPRMRRHVRRQLVLISTADICTLDSWAGRLVRENFSAARMDPGFTTLGGEDAALLRSEVLDELFEGVYSGRHALAGEARTWIARHHATDDHFLREMVVELFRFSERLLAPEGWFARAMAWHSLPPAELMGESRRVLAEAFAEECRFQAEQITKMLGGDGVDEVSQAGLEAFRAALKAWREGVEERPERLVEILGEMALFTVCGKRGKKSAEAPPLLKQVSQGWYEKRLKQRWDPKEIGESIEQSPDSSKLACTLVRLTAAFRERLDEVKRQRACHEFGDIQRKALELLGGAERGGPRAATEIARQLQQRYEHILVDEYQDTSPVQVEMLRLVTREADVRNGRTANRFAVGDVKQSIYGFRQAEPRLFVDQIREFERDSGAGINIFLSDNFRSHSRLLDGLNGIFETVLHDELGGRRYSEREKLNGRRAELPNPTLDGRARIEICLVDPEAAGSAHEKDSGATEDEQELERIEREGKIAVVRIQELLRSGVKVLMKDTLGQPCLRAAAFSDIVILLRSVRVNAGRVAGILREAGIECITNGRESILDSAEVMDVRNVLALLVSRRQDLSMAAYLRSPMVGLSADDLLAVRDAHPTDSYAVAVERLASGEVFAGGASDGLREKLQSALGRLESWSAAARHCELPELLRRIYRDTAVELVAAGMRSGQHRVEMLHALVRYAAEFGSSGQNGIGEFIAYLDELGAQEIAPEVPVAASENAVRIMTIHAAKGLEFPIVFILGAGNRFNEQGSRSALQLDEAEGLGLTFLDYRAGRKLVTPQHLVIRQKVRHRDLEEEMRLLYVAATRARELLIVVGHCGADEWANIQATSRALAGRAPLISLMGASRMLEWVLWGAAALEARSRGPDGVPLVTAGFHTGWRGTAAEPAIQSEHDNEDVATSANRGAWDEADDAWVRRGVKLLREPVDQTLARIPAALSVSAIKERLASGTESRAERPVELGRLNFPTALRRPHVGDVEREQTGATEYSAAEAGTALHRFLQHCDFGCLSTETEIRGQLSAMVDGRRLTMGEAAMISVEDVAWLGSLAESKLLIEQEGFCRREVPFTFACPAERLAGGAATLEGESVIVRGVIDCLIDAPDGLTIFDYKTDEVNSEPKLNERTAGYRSQLQIYAMAAEAIFGKQVKRAALIFVRGRRVKDVAVQAEKLEVFIGRL